MGNGRNYAAIKKIFEIGETSYEKVDFFTIL